MFDLSIDLWQGPDKPPTQGTLPPVPRVITSEIKQNHPDGILVIFDRPMMMTCDIKGQINVIIDGGAAVHPKSIEFHPNYPTQMAIVMNDQFAAGQTVTWAYDDSGACELQETAPPNTEADNQTYAVNNQLTSPNVVDGADNIVDGSDNIIDG